MDTGKNEQDTETERLRLWLRHMKMARLIENRLRRLFRDEFGTTVPRFDMLATLNRHPEGLIMSALSRELKVAASNTTGVVNALLREGLVEQCTVAGDRRASLVRLTPQGRAEFTRQSASLRKWIGTLLAPLEAQEAAMVSVAHDRVIAALLEGNGQNNDPSGHR